MTYWGSGMGYVLMVLSAISALIALIANLRLVRALESAAAAGDEYPAYAMADYDGDAFPSSGDQDTDSTFLVSPGFE